MKLIAIVLMFSAVLGCFAFAAITENQKESKAGLFVLACLGLMALENMILMICL